MIKETPYALLEWKPVSERLLYARQNSRHAKLSIVVGYAPTENADEEAKDDVYDSLQFVTEGIPKHDVLLMLGDFNARVGSNNENRESTIGKHGVGPINDNGERL